MKTTTITALVNVCDGLEQLLKTLQSETNLLRGYAGSDLTHAVYDLREALKHEDVG